VLQDRGGNSEKQAKFESTSKRKKREKNLQEIFDISWPQHEIWNHQRHNSDSDAMEDSELEKVNRRLDVSPKEKHNNSEYNERQSIHAANLRLIKPQHFIK
jgi:hypothetical protein